ncbi:hypothetical protein [Tropicimonas sp. IMCC6043]|uniref:hypothetical protein n=1 Tax=Tropicimonas sp. IMCC6043 TaxID=2510645 RepID=UPI00101C42F6|nr:hypothetical protein [Tropicimonas sp. IMCC6043]RYH06376.1 hypothetical protein EU800_24055 [Tropicimonas sp. IMCC6043]
MTHVDCIDARPFLIGSLLQLMRTATLERTVLPDGKDKEIDEHILLESHLVRTPHGVVVRKLASG